MEIAKSNLKELMEGFSEKAEHFDSGVFITKEVQVGYTETKEPVEYGWHVHNDSVEFFVLIKGQMIVERKNGIDICHKVKERERLKAPSMTFVKQGVEHKVFVSENSKLLWVTVPPEMEYMIAGKLGE